MGNHSDTGELLEEAKVSAITERKTSVKDSLIDEFGNIIKLDQPPEELQSKTKLANPTELKDSANRGIKLLRNEIPGGIQVVEDKSKKKKTS